MADTARNWIATAEMASASLQIAGVVRRYCDELNRRGIHCERALLFGSHAKGTAYADSDIDLIIVSSDWSPYSQRERLEILGIAAARIFEPIQASGFTPEEIADHRLPSFWEYIISEDAVPV